MLDEEKILVMFPSSKNYPKDEERKDPLPEALEEVEELLKNTASGKGAPSHIDVQHGHTPSVRMSLDELVEMVDAQVELLKENTKRMKFYMDEIEFFWPDSND